MLYVAQDHTEGQHAPSPHHPCVNSSSRDIDIIARRDMAALLLVSRLLRPPCLPLSVTRLDIYVPLLLSRCISMVLPPAPSIPTAGHRIPPESPREVPGRQAGVGGTGAVLPRNR